MTSDLEQRLTTEPEPPPMPSNEPSKANVFFKTPHGDGHIQIVAGEHPVIIAKLVKNVQVVLKWCEDNGFEARPATGIPATNGTGKKKGGGGRKPSPSGPECGICGGKTWDNTEAREQGSKRPAYKCRDTDCGGIDWVGNGDWVDG